MKTRLCELTMAEYIDLVCGDLDVLAYGDGIKAKRAEVRRNIMLEYQSITDTASVKRYLTKGQKTAKAKGLVSIFAICKALTGLSEFESVREIFRELRIDTSRWDDERVSAEVDSRLARAERDCKELEKTEGVEQTPDEIRRHYDMQTAFLMSHFRFQIDVSTMSASVYASLLAQCQREVKAQTEAVNRHKSKRIP